MAAKTPLHIAIAADLGWGHVRPLCALAARIVRLRDADVTLLTACRVHGLCVQELARNFEDGEDALLARIRLVGLAQHETNMFDRSVVVASFDAAIQRVLAGEPVPCAATKGEVPALRAPDALIVDILGHEYFESARKHSSALKTFVSMPPSLLAMHALSTKVDDERLEEQKAAVEKIMKETGKTLGQATDQMMGGPSDEIVTIPGLPPMYNYEQYPQELVFDQGEMGQFYLTVPNLIRGCNGLFSASMACIEPPEMIDLFTKFMATIGSEPLRLLGPLLPQTKREEEVERREIARSPEISSFLKKVLEKHGERSMLYISFGTVFWSTQPEKVWTFLDVLLDKKIPFIMAHASPFCQVPDETMAKVKASGTGLFVPWAPQQAILEHSATGWFVTHGGFNGIVESIHAGVPMICWPFFGDQPMNVVHLTDNLDVAYELLEVRNGPWGLKPIYRTGVTPTGTLDAVRAEASTVLEKAFGKDGARKRVNVQKLRDAALELWKEGGEARIATEQLLDSITA
ncbi:glycosyltransferase family 1 protein [Phanerochaete sordida]|uniref:Glycosyltransferase family 1 protein n=1 Tax=Phanerochaete sordida TaxID=48140 RepID=A0A9P3GAD2_9APHY|nr:glycosyltransferase family 1 protein [Phanerochaete sordida]